MSLADRNHKEVLTSARHSILGGKVVLHQDPAGGHRAGLDAVLLAASVDPATEACVVDLGAGVGSAGLCVAARHGDISVTLVENDPTTLTYAHLTLADPDNAAIAKRASLLPANVCLRGEARTTAGLTPNMADVVIMNPPYWDKRKVRASPIETKAAAHILNDDGIEPWMRTAAAILKNGGVVSTIFPAEALASLITVIESRFGGLQVIPIYKGEAEHAIRIVVRAIKGSRAPLQILPGLMLHDAAKEGQSRRPYTKRANEILNGETGLVI